VKRVHCKSLRTEFVIPEFDSVSLQVASVTNSNLSRKQGLFSLSPAVSLDQGNTLQSDAKPPHLLELLSHNTAE